MFAAMIYDVQKANMWKRFSAYLLDFIVLGILAVGVAFLLSVVVGYDDHSAHRDELKKAYEQQYGVEFSISQDEYDKLSDEQKDAYEQAYTAFVNDPEVNKTDLLIINLTLIITAFGVLVPYILLELIVPMLFKNGQTLGKKIFGIAVMRVDGVRISPLQLAVRTILGKYTVETMLPILLILMFLFNFMPLACVIGLGVIILTQFIMIVATRMRTPIHDMISGTVTVDLASQLIFDSPEELMEYKKKLHAEAAEAAQYK